jgi:hypothetical protein
VPHAVLSEKFALEQTVMLEQTIIVSRNSLRTRKAAPASILEKIAVRPLTV